MSTTNDKTSREIIDQLKRAPLHEPPPWLDTQIREMVLDGGNASMFRPIIAFGLTTAAFLAVLVGLASVLADTAIAEWGPGIAAAIGFGYLAISAAAALPLLIEHRQRFGGQRVDT